MAGIDFAKEHWHQTVDLPDEYEVRDFTTGDDSPSKFEFDIGRYDEVRPGMYNTCLLYTSPSPRDRSLSRMPSSV